VVVEAKIFSKLSKGSKNFENYDQAARTTACIAQTLSLGQRQLRDISRLGFYVCAPENQLKFEPTFQTFLEKDSIRIKVHKRIKAYSDPADAETKNRWFQTWIDKVNKVDFFVLDAVKHDEMWVLPKEKIFELIKLNEHRYSSRPDNVFNYEAPLKQKQKEMNLDIEIEGEKLTEKFAEYLDNFQLILDALAKSAIE
jgi:hypothetical protein